MPSNTLISAWYAVEKENHNNNYSFFVFFVKIKKKDIGIDIELRVSVQDLSQTFLNDIQPYICYIDFVIV